MPIDIEVTEDDYEAARAVGATGAQLMQFAVNRALDRMGIPREGRTVTVTAETITIDLPPGYTLPELGARGAGHASARCSHASSAAAIIGIRSAVTANSGAPVGPPRGTHTTSTSGTPSRVTSRASYRPPAVGATGPVTWYRPGTKLARRSRG